MTVPYSRRKASAAVAAAARTHPTCATSQALGPADGTLPNRKHQNTRTNRHSLVETTYYCVPASARLTVCE